MVRAESLASRRRRPTISDKRIKVDSQLLGVGRVFVVGMLVADGFGVGVGADFVIEPSAGIFPARFAGQGQSPFSETFSSSTASSKRGEISYFADSKRVQVLFGDLAYAWDFAHIEGSQKFRFLARSNP